MQYVYVVKAGVDQYKVGIAKSPRRRVRELQTASGHKVHIITTKLCIDAYEVEQRIHKLLANYQSEGGTEWFTLTPELVLKVCIYLQEEPEVDVHTNLSLREEIEKQKEALEDIMRPLEVLYKRTNKVLDKQDSDTVKHQVNRILGGKGWTRAERNLDNSISEEEKIRSKEEENLSLILSALEIGFKYGKISTSLLQRKLGIGYGKSASLMDELEKWGVITEQDGNRARILVHNKATERRDSILSYRASLNNPGPATKPE